MITTSSKSKTLLFTISLSLSVFSLNTYGVERVHTDRYTTVNLEVPAEQKMPLATIANFVLSDDVATVGEAISEVLKGTGYRWQSPDDADSLLSKLPLPSVVRQMGPVRIEDALKTFAGQAWELHTDHLNRTIWFEPK